MSPRGGARRGTPGKSYNNRADLRAVKPLAPTAAPGQTYGSATQQLQAQQQMPVAPQPSPVPPGPPTVAPGGLGALDRPTERPQEPLTAGNPLGSGPSSIPGLPNTGLNTDMTRLIRMLPLLEVMASNPNASTQTRQIYRQVLDAHLRSQSAGT